jgi:CO/xanthine dehydrogenase FAD-binding subunit
VKPAPFAYRRPGSLAEALSALASETNAKVLAGGQSLVPLLSMRLAAPAVLVDINGVPGLATTASGWVRSPGTPTSSPRRRRAASSRSWRWP